MELDNKALSELSVKTWLDPNDSTGLELWDG